MQHHVTAPAPHTARARSTDPLSLDPDELHRYAGKSLRQVIHSEVSIAIVSALMRKGSIAAAARELGYTREGLSRVLRRHGIDAGRVSEERRILERQVQ